MPKWVSTSDEIGDFSAPKATITRHSKIYKLWMWLIFASPDDSFVDRLRKTAVTVLVVCCWAPLLCFSYLLLYAKYVEGRITVGIAVGMTVTLCGIPMCWAPYLISRFSISRKVSTAMMDRTLLMFFLAELVTILCWPSYGNRPVCYGLALLAVISEARHPKVHCAIGAFLYTLDAYNNAFLRDDKAYALVPEYHFGPPLSEFICTLGGGCCAALVVVGVFFQAQQMKLHVEETVRDNTWAPKSGAVALLFTDIQSSTKLWSTCPCSMAVALETHHAVIRESIKQWKAYEVKTVGDAFMIASDDVGSAMGLARDVQLALMRCDFPRAIGEVYAAETDADLHNVIDVPDNKVSGDGLQWNGLRVRIGVHLGKPDIVYDEVTKGYDYYGPPANIAARIESVGDGGQVTLSSDVQEALPLSQRGGMTISWLAEKQLKGVSGTTEIFQMVPNELAGRTFCNEKSAQESSCSATSEHSSNNDDDGEAAEDNKQSDEVLAVLCHIAKVMQPAAKATWLRVAEESWGITQTDSSFSASRLTYLSRRIGSSIGPSTAETAATAKMTIAVQPGIPTPAWGGE